MLVAAPHIGPNKAFINALFVQPTTFCGLNCNGCYVKGFEKQNNFSDSGRSVAGYWWNFFTFLNRKEGLSTGIGTLNCNQITFALDSFSNNENYNLDLISIAQAFFSMKPKLLTSINLVDGCEYHATTHNIGTFLGYINNRSIKGQVLAHQNKILDMLSISSIFPDELYHIEHMRSFVESINWNLTIDPKVNLDKVKGYFKEVATGVDTIYLVLHKPSTGQRFDPEAFEAHQDFIKFIRTMPIDIQKKVTIDGCVSDSKRFLDAGYGCSSNVSRFQVWPDGSVSGCPYSQTRVTGPTSFNNSNEFFNGILMNIYQASKVYEFNKCKIPSHLDPNNPRVNPKHHLEIIE